MSKLSVSSKAVSIVAALVLVSVLVVGADKAASKPTTKYEYSSIDVLTIGEDTRVAFRDASGKTTTARDMSDLSERLGVRGEGSFLSILNRLGSRGWRLSLLDYSRTEEGTVHSYIMERQHSN